MQVALASSCENCLNPSIKPVSAGGGSAYLTGPTLKLSGNLTPDAGSGCCIVMHSQTTA